MNRPTYDKRIYEGTPARLDSGENEGGGSIAVKDSPTGLETKVDNLHPGDVLKRFPDVKPSEYVTGGAE